MRAGVGSVVRPTCDLGEGICRGKLAPRGHGNILLQLHQSIVERLQITAMRGKSQSMWIAYGYDHAHFLCCSGRVLAFRCRLSLNAASAGHFPVAFQLEPLALQSSQSLLRDAGKTLRYILQRTQQ